MQIVTANRLSDGRVVFLAEAGWSTAIAASLLLPDQAALDAALARAAADTAANRMVDAYAIAVTAEGGRIVPTKLRERIRVSGPTAGNSRQPAPADKAA